MSKVPGSAAGARFNQPAYLVVIRYETWLISFTASTEIPHKSARVPRTFTLYNIFINGVIENSVLVKHCLLRDDLHCVMLRLLRSIGYQDEIIYILLRLVRFGLCTPRITLKVPKECPEPKAYYKAPYSSPGEGSLNTTRVRSSAGNRY